MAIECICFFKQKTAYEMRISDWSSDVCSSDLFRIVGAVLEESLADSLCDGAVHLPFNHHRIDYSPGVVDSIKLPHTDMAGISVDHDDTKVNCRWCIAPFRVKKHLLLKSRSEEHTSELQSLMRISYAVFCLKNKKH